MSLLSSKLTVCVAFLCCCFFSQVVIAAETQKTSDAAPVKNEFIKMEGVEFKESMVDKNNMFWPYGFLIVFALLSCFFVFYLQPKIDISSLLKKNKMDSIHVISSKRLSSNLMIFIVELDNERYLITNKGGITPILKNTCQEKNCEE